METGKLRHRLLIESFTEARGADGSVIKSWVTLDTVWGSVRPAQGREIINGEQVEAQVDHIIEIRRRADILTSHRVTHLTRVFHITSVKNVDERHKMTRLECREVAASV